MPGLKEIIAFFLLPAFVLLPEAGKAQADTQITVSFADSVMAEKNSRIVNHHITLTNQAPTSLSFTLQQTPPAGWRALVKNEEIVLLPGEKHTLLLTLLPSANAPASWQPFWFALHEKSGRKTTYRFWVKAFPVALFSAMLIGQKVDLGTNDKEIPIDIRISNQGNIPNTLMAEIRNNVLDINYRQRIALDAQEDTLLSLRLPVPRHKLQNMVRENLSVRISDSTGMIKLFLAEVHRLASSRKQNPSTYATIPVEIENGYIYLEKRLSYYAGFTGRVLMNKNRSLNLSYRSIEFGLENQVQNHVVNLDFRSERLSLYAGQISAVGNFANFGNGIRAQYVLSPKLTALFSASHHTNHSYLKNNNIEAGIKLTQKQFTSEHSLAANFDKRNSVTSYLLQNQAGFRVKKRLAAAFQLGVGTDHYQGRTAVPRAVRPGFAFEYNVRYTPEHFVVQSRVQHYDRYFPGIKKALQSQSHDVYWTANKWLLGVFYQFNQSNPTILRDSVYNTDVIAYNTQRYGLGLGMKLKKMSFSLNTGKFRQIGASNNNLNAYSFFETSYNLKIGKAFGFRLHAINGFGQLNAKTPQRLWINNSSAGVSYKIFSVTGIFTQMPYITNIPERRFERYQQTLHVSPSFTFAMLNRFHCSFQYGLSKSIYDNDLTSYVNGRVGYTGKRNGLNIHISGLIPIKRSKLNLVGIGRDYITVSIKKAFSIPLLHRKKYVDLKLLAFDDANSNGKMEDNEKGLKDIKIKINETLFSSSGKGAISYKNVHKGQYLLDLSYIDNLKGSIPANGLQQHISVDRNTTVTIPFKKSKIISGSVAVVMDSLSNLRFSPSGLKVVATDSSGKIYSSLCNEKGQFLINVPAGFYVVSLNPEAFDEKIKPDTMAFPADLRQAEESQVQFNIRQQKRKLRILKTN